MIIFNLDDTLADCEHRRHFVVAKHWRNSQFEFGGTYKLEGVSSFYSEEQIAKFKPDWKAFYEACDQDIPIQPTIAINRSLSDLDYCGNDNDIHIWSGRCESVREKTEKWLDDHKIYYYSLKMRPIGDYTPDDELKEKWLKEVLAKGYKISYVFDDRPKVIRMWRRNGIFVFNCCQHDEEF
jgi:hypothetical protein